MKGVTKNFFVRATIENAPAMHINDSNHVRGIFSNQAKQFLSTDQAAAHAVYLKLLVKSVNVEDENEGDEAADHLRCPLLRSLIAM